MITTAFQVWPVTPPVPVLHLLSSAEHGMLPFQLIPVYQASLFFYHLIMLWTILNFSPDGSERLCVTFKVKLFSFFFDVFSTCPLAWHTWVWERPRAFFISSIVMALHDHAQESSQALQRTEHYASVAYRLVYFIQRLLKLIVNQQTFTNTRCCAFPFC